jgi:hypothetical protein
MHVKLDKALFLEHSRRNSEGKAISGVMLHFLFHSRGLLLSAVGGRTATKKGEKGKWHLQILDHE